MFICGVLVHLKVNIFTVLIFHVVLIKICFFYLHLLMSFALLSAFATVYGDCSCFFNSTDAVRSTWRSVPEYMCHHVKDSQCCCVSLFVADISLMLVLSCVYAMTRALPFTVLLFGVL